MLHYYLNNYYYLVSTHVYIFLVCANKNIKKMRTNTGKHINPVHQIILVMKKLWNGENRANDTWDSIAG